MHARHNIVKHSLHTRTHRTTTSTTTSTSHRKESSAQESDLWVFTACDRLAAWLRKKKETKTAGKKNSRSPLHGLEDLITTHYCLSIIYHCTAQYWEGGVGQRTSRGCTVPRLWNSSGCTHFVWSSHTPVIAKQYWEHISCLIPLSNNRKIYLLV